MKKFINTKFKLFLFLFIFLFSCKSNRFESDISKIKFNLEVKNFKSYFFSIKNEINNKVIIELKKDYPYFFNAFTHQVLAIQNDSSLIIKDLNRFKEDYFIIQINKKIDSVYSEKRLNKISDNLENGFKRYLYQFDKQALNIPKIIFYNSGYNYSVAIDSFFIAVGLEMFLGENYFPYKQLGFPEYKTKEMTPNHLSIQVIKGWLEVNYENTDKSTTLISEMLYQGILLFLTQIFLPEIKEKDLLGYSKQQLEWCYKNEKKIWKYFIKNNLVYSKNKKHLATFIYDSPFISEFPEGSPGKVGQWIGLKIIQSYMNANTTTNLKQLLEFPKKTLLNQSKYKP